MAVRCRWSPIRSGCGTPRHGASETRPRCSTAPSSRRCFANTASARPHCLLLGRTGSCLGRRFLRSQGLLCMCRHRLTWQDLCCQQCMPRGAAAHQHRLLPLYGLPGADLTTCMSCKQEIFQKAAAYASARGWLLWQTKGGTLRYIIAVLMNRHSVLRHFACDFWPCLRAFL